MLSVCCGETAKSSKLCRASYVRRSIKNAQTERNLRINKTLSTGAKISLFMWGRAKYCFHT